MNRAARACVCIVAVSAVLLTVIVTAASTEFDVTLSDRIFDHAGESWPVSHEKNWLRLTFYEGAKYLIILTGLYLITAILYSPLLRPVALDRTQALFVVLCLIIVPAVIVTIRHYSNVLCPGQLLRYGGTSPDIQGHFGLARLFGSERGGGCWPSGHASGGFALLALGYIGETRSRRVLLWVAGALFGSAMGAYQVARGAHFVSHILVTGLMAQLLICAIAGFVFADRHVRSS